ncbi:hypothetical protein GCE9029_01080 [Grimontia celer]|uniref:BIG2 domain-containing protein n=1 Tax=Grimontia celer TaxID=1796497 RepID=A0A128EW97_9GAMM|nr:hypothetical protein [Grimontia celer]CZF78829.1 hypothetical protein GCE9029_01080 [Grimontia celer]
MKNWNTFRWRIAYPLVTAFMLLGCDGGSGTTNQSTSKNKDASQANALESTTPSSQEGIKGFQFLGAQATNNDDDKGTNKTVNLSGSSGNVTSASRPANSGTSNPSNTASSNSPESTPPPSNVSSTQTASTNTEKTSNETTDAASVGPASVNAGSSDIKQTTTSAGTTGNANETQPVASSQVSEASLTTEATGTSETGTTSEQQSVSTEAGKGTSESAEVGSDTALSTVGSETSGQLETVAQGNSSDSLTSTVSLTDNTADTDESAPETQTPDPSSTIEIANADGTAEQDTPSTATDSGTSESATGESHTALSTGSEASGQAETTTEGTSSDSAISTASLTESSVDADKRTSETSTTDTNAARETKAAGESTTTTNTESKSTLATDENTDAGSGTSTNHTTAEVTDQSKENVEESEALVEEDTTLTASMTTESSSSNAGSSETSSSIEVLPDVTTESEAFVAALVEAIEGANTATESAEATPTKRLTKIELAPYSSVVFFGTVQFTATGTYDDGSTEDITQQVLWNSSNSNIGDLDSNGLATLYNEGSIKVSAKLDGISSNEAFLTGKELVCGHKFSQPFQYAANDRDSANAAGGCVKIAETGQGTWFTSAPSAQAVIDFEFPISGTTYWEMGHRGPQGNFISLNYQESNAWCSWLNRLEFAGRKNWKMPNDSQLKDLHSQLGDMHINYGWPGLWHYYSTDRGWFGYWTRSLKNSFSWDVFANDRHNTSCMSVG